MESEIEFQLWRGDDLLGTLTSCSPDFPWLRCKFEPAASFEEQRALFENELRLLDLEDMVAWEQAYEQIRALNLRLVSAQENLSEFLLHVDGDEAWFRY